MDTEYYKRKESAFLALCTFLENTEHKGSIDTDSIQAYATLLRIVGLGIQSDIGIGENKEEN